MKEAASLLSSDYPKIYMKAMYRTFIARCKFVEESNFRRIEFLKSSFLEMTPLDVQQSYIFAISSLQQLASVVKQGLRTKKKVHLFLKLWFVTSISNFVM
jgi:nucleolar complex protein 2